MIKKIAGAISLLTALTIAIAGCGESEQEIAVNNAKSKAAVEKQSSELKSSGTVIAKKIGGSATITLPSNQKLQLVTWKTNDSLWLLYRPMRKDEEAETYTYREDSRFGIMETIITIKEVKE